MIIAKQEIQYGGKTYKAGAPLPEQDVLQVSRWLKAGSAIRAGEKKVKKAEKPTSPAKPGKPALKKPIEQPKQDPALGSAGATAQEEVKDEQPAGSSPS